MAKILNLLAAAGAAAATPAFAQSSPTLADSIGATEVAALLKEFGIASELRPAPAGGSPSLIASMSTGAKFLVGFFECADAARPSGCKQIMVSTAMSSGGVAFEDLNSFNGQSSVTTVVYEPSNQILIFGRNIFMPGGVGRENFKLQVALFLGDMQNFVEGRRLTAKSVSLPATPKLKSKITSITAEESATPPAFAVGFDRGTEVELAISNSVDVDFSLPSAD